MGGFLCMFMLYHYLLCIHSNGRVLDIYRRLHTNNFFVPLDFELSPNEFRQICKKSASWRGPDGSVRKIAVCKYVHVDITNLSASTSKDSSNSDTHVVIYNQSLAGDRKMHR